MDFYNSLVEKLKANKNIKIQDPQDAPGAINLDKKIFEQIDETDIFIVDVTPDYVDNVNNRTTFNEHVMIEYGYALKNYDHENILIIHYKDMYTDETKLPLFIQTKNWHTYDISQGDIDNIYELAINVMKTSKKKNTISDGKQQEINIYEIQNKKLYEEIKNCCNSLQYKDYNFKVSIEDTIKYNNIKDLYDKIMLLLQDYSQVQFNNENGLRTIYSKIREINQNNYKLNSLNNNKKLQHIDDKKLLSDNELYICFRKMELVNDMKSLGLTEKDYNSIKTIIDVNNMKDKTKMNVVERLRMQIKNDQKNRY
jgi:hypothetical protein